MNKKQAPVASRFVYSLRQTWPPLAWLAECSEDTPEILVQHGSSVELREDWFCEAVWDGDFDAGGFDETDIVFGSGGRIRPDRTVFVSSGDTVDRLQFLTRGKKTFVSNSIACLKSITSGWPSTEIDSSSTNSDSYFQFFASVVQGLRKYEPTLPNGGPTLVYFKNLSWDGRALSLCDKPLRSRDFGSFDAYVAFLIDSLRALAGNADDPSRRLRYGLIGTASSGYDSPTVAALAVHAGLKEVVSFATAREEAGDDGKEIAEHLGLDVTVLSRQAWRSEKMAEIYFLAADAEGGDIVYAGAKDKIRRKVLLTGYHGDKVWEKETKVSLTPDIVRGDMSGLSFTEYRLLTETIHVPVAFMGVRDIKRIVAISGSSEMTPWDVGGDYNRPICRRVLEQRGVRRESFGMHKKATSNLFSAGDVTLTRPARIDFDRWFSEASTGFEGANNRPTRLSRWLSRSFIPEVWAAGEQLARRILTMLPTSIEQGISWRLVNLRFKLFKRINFFMRWAFPWAMDRLAAVYREGERR
jgi:hypothetical protein